MTADLHQAIIATHGEDKPITTAKSKTIPTTRTSPPSSPPRKYVSNPQQGMVDPASAASVSATTQATCTSPLTVTSLEAAAAAGTAAADKANTTTAVPAVVSSSRVVPVTGVLPQLELEGLLAPLAKLGLANSSSNAPALPPALDTGANNLVPPPPPPESYLEEKKMQRRTPPTEHDNRKLFVGGLPTDVTDHGFLDFFQQYGEVIDSVVMVDRTTKRSRGFGFVTFATEEDANAILTSIPGKTGYVVINGKQCEVKASTPKNDDGPARHTHHGAPGMWRSNPPNHRDGHNHHNHHRGGYSSRSNKQGTQHYHNNHYQPRGEKNLYIEQEYNGDDGRNFDELYVPAYAGQPQVGYSAQPGAVYGRTPGFTGQSTMYQQNYQNVYAQGAAYANSPTAASGVPSSWEASYPGGSAGGYGGQYDASNAAVSGGNGGYYDPYAAQYPSQYAAQYSNRSAAAPAPAMMMGQAAGGYAGYNTGYYSEGSGAPVPAPGVIASVTGGFEPYPQSYPADAGNYNEQGDEQYE